MTDKKEFCIIIYENQTIVIFMFIITYFFKFNCLSVITDNLNYHYYRTHAQSGESWSWGRESVITIPWYG